MIRRIEYHPGARRDFDEAFDWYRQRSPLAASRRFIIAIDDAIARLANQPNRFASTWGGCRYCLVKRFPFHIIYWHDDEQVFIIAIAHGKRRPNYWRARV